MNPIRVLMVDDHALVRDGVVTVLSSYAHIRVVGEASDGAGAIEAYRRLRPDVTLMDLSMPAGDIVGVDAMAILRREDPEARFVVLTTYGGDEDVRRAVAAGARAFLLKDASRQELVRVIEAVHRGETAFTPDIQSRLAAPADAFELTSRELDVLRLLTRGLTNAQIASTLAISASTVEKHVNHIMTKLDVTNRGQAILVALERGLVALNR